MIGKKAITKMQSILLIAVVIIAAISATTAYYLTRPVASGETLFRLGVWAPFSGPTAMFGVVEQGLVTLAVEDLKEAGVFPMILDGVNYTGAKLVSIDEDADPDLAVKSYTYALSQDKVQLIVGGFHSSCTLPILSMSTQYGVIHVGDGADSELIDLKRNTTADLEQSKYWFKTFPCPRISYTTALIDGFKALMNNNELKLRNTNVAIVAEDSDWGRDYAAALTPKLKNELPVSLDTVSYDVVPLNPPTVDFYALLTKYNNLNVSMVVTLFTPLTMNAAFLKQARETNSPFLTVAQGLTLAPDWASVAGTAADYSLLPGTIPSTKFPEAANLTKRLATWGVNFDDSQANTYFYSTTKWILGGLKQLGTLDPAKIREWILQNPTPSLYGFEVKYSTDRGPNGEYPEEAWMGYPDYWWMALCQVNNETLKTVWPPSVKDANFTMPAWAT